MKKIIIIEKCRGCVSLDGVSGSYSCMKTGKKLDKIDKVDKDCILCSFIEKSFDCDKCKIKDSCKKSYYFCPTGIPEGIEAGPPCSNPLKRLNG